MAIADRVTEENNNEALQFFKKAIENDPDRVRELDRALRVSNLADVMPPLRRPEDRAQYIEGMRKAGLPE